MYSVVYVYGCIPVRTYICVRISSYVWLRATAFRIRLVRSGPVAGDPDPIRIRARCGPDTKVIRRPTHGMIRISVPVRTVKTRRRFSSEIASFHVSVCSSVVFYFTVIVF